MKATEPVFPIKFSDKLSLVRHVVKHVIDADGHYRRTDEKWENIFGLDDLKDALGAVMEILSPVCSREIREVRKYQDIPFSACNRLMKDPRFRKIAEAYQTHATELQQDGCERNDGHLHCLVEDSCNSKVEQVIYLLNDQENIIVISAASVRGDQVGVYRIRTAYRNPDIAKSYIRSMCDNHWSRRVKYKSQKIEVLAIHDNSSYTWKMKNER